MKQPNLTEGVNTELVAAIRRDVKLEEIIRCYYKNINDELAAQRGRRKRLDSPFGPPGNKSVIIFQNPDNEEEELHWADPLAPQIIPRDVVGFQMAFKGWSYEEAVEELAAFREGSLRVARRVEKMERRHQADPIKHPKEALLAEIRYSEERRAAIEETDFFDRLRSRIGLRANSAIGEKEQQ